MGHFYDRSGNPCYTVKDAKGNLRDSTLRDARKFGWVPSVTEILNVVAKPALTNWLVNQGIMAALTGTRLEGESDPVYIARILKESQQQAKDAAEAGSRIHDACETFVRDGSCHDNYLAHATAAKAELHRLFPDVNDWVCEKSFAHPLGYGGKCDLSSPSTGIIVDYKTKDGALDDGKKLAWDQHWQLSAYQVGLGLTQHEYVDPAGNDVNGNPIMHVSPPSAFKPGAAIFISRTHPGAVASYQWSAEDMAAGWRMFHCALNMFKCMKDYDAAFTP